MAFPFLKHVYICGQELSVFAYAYVCLCVGGVCVFVLCEIV